MASGQARCGRGHAAYWNVRMAGTPPNEGKIVAQLGPGTDRGRTWQAKFWGEGIDRMQRQAAGPFSAWHRIRARTRTGLVQMLARSAAAALVAALLPMTPTSAWAAHGFALHGDLKYPPDFHHFDYVNPDAPRGGTLTLANPDRRTSFDKFNPFTLKGVAAPGLTSLMFESLLIGSADETASAYGLLAEDVTVAPDELSVTFRIHPQARFHNGDPVLASDVKYSFDMLMSKASSPGYRSMCADVKSLTVIDDRTVRYDFKQRNGELPLIVGSLPVFSRKWTAKVPFEKLTFETPVTSGPYVIERYDAGRGIIYKRNPNYWGKDLAVRRGTFNFDRVVYRLYKDETARLEAFKAGEFDAIVEYRSKSWAKSYVGKRFANGELMKTEFPPPQWRGHAGLRDEHAQAAVPGRARAPGADPRARFRMAEPAAVLRRLQAPRQLVLQQRAGRQRDLRRPSRPRRAGPARAAARPAGARGIRSHRHAADHRAAALVARQPARSAPGCWRRRAGPIATGRCATPGASPSCSSSSTTAAR
ncbi:hypothetical protein OJJOAM_002979 [Cupriavidus sp. H18C1]